MCIIPRVATWQPLAGPRERSEEAHMSLFVGLEASRHRGPGSDSWGRRERKGQVFSLGDRERNQVRMLSRAQCPPPHNGDEKGTFLAESLSTPWEACTVLSSPAARNQRGFIFKHFPASQINFNQIEVSQEYFCKMSGSTS